MQGTTKQKNRSQALWAASSLVAIAMLSQVASGASGTWTAADAVNNTNWSNPLNWSGGVPSGTGDIATFNNSPTNSAVTVDGAPTIRSVLFDTGAGSFTFANPLALFSTGGVTLASTLAGANVTQTFNSPISLAGAAGGGYKTYLFNNASDPGSKLVFAGGINGTNTSGTTTLVLGGSAAGTNVISGAISQGAGTMAVQVTSGQWSMSGANLYLGDTTVFGSADLILDANVNAAASLDFTTVVLGGGSLKLLGPAGTDKSLYNLRMLNDGGHSTISVADNTVLNLNAIRRDAGWATLDFVLPAGPQTSSNGITTTSTTLKNELLWGTTDTTAFATVNGSNWATVSAGNIVPFTGYAVARDIGVGGLISDGNILNWRITNSTGTGTIGLVNALKTNTNTLLLQADAAAVATTINIAAAQTLGTSGILMAAGNTGSLTIGDTVATGTLSNYGQDLVLINNSAQTLTINANLAASSNKGIVKSGSGTLVINSTNNTAIPANTKFFLNGGITQIAADGSLGTVPATFQSGLLMMDGGTLRLGAQFDLNSNRGLAMVGAGGTFDTNGFDSTYGGAIRGINGTSTEGFTKAGAGTLTFTASGHAYTGATTVKGGTLALSAAGTLGNNTTGVVLANSAIFDLSAKTAVFTMKGLSGEGTVSVAAGQQLAMTAALNAQGSLDTINITGGGLKLGATSVFEIDLSTGVFDSTTIAGALDYNSKDILVAFSGAAGMDTEFPIFTFGSKLGTPSSVSFIGTNAGSASFDAATGIVSVPEPASLAFVGLVGLMGLRRRH